MELQLLTTKFMKEKTNIIFTRADKRNVHFQDEKLFDFNTITYKVVEKNSVKR